MAETESDLEIAQLLQWSKTALVIALLKNKDEVARLQKEVEKLTKGPIVHVPINIHVGMTNQIATLQKVANDLYEAGKLMVLQVDCSSEPCGHCKFLAAKKLYEQQK